MFYLLIGEDFWLSYGDFPTEVDNIQFKMEDTKGFDFLSLKYSEKRMTLLDKDNVHCKNYPTYDNFIQCSKDKIWSMLIEHHINCTIAGMKEILPKNLFLKECDDENSARKVKKLLTEILNIFITNRDDYGCPLPCQQTIFTTKKRFLHKNVMEDNLLGQNNSNSFLVEIYSNKGVVEESEEMLIYDFGNFVAAAGGNLGLFLGFSCLSVLLLFKNFIRKRLTG